MSLKRMLVCGTAVPSEFELDAKGVSIAGSRFLNNITSVLDDYYEIHTESYIGVELSDDLKRKIADKDPNCTFRTKGYFAGMLRYLKRVITEVKKSEYVMTYNVISAWVLVPIIAGLHKKKRILILADFTPPEEQKTGIRKLYARFQRSMMKKYEFIIGLSESTEKYLNENQRFYCVVGGINRTVYDYFNTGRQNAADTVNIMYAGTLEPVTGIDMLIEAFKNVHGDNIRLIITGRGSLEQPIIKSSREDSRIQYLGCVEYGEYLDNLAVAEILVNPRNMSLPENDNNFPSKVLDYLATGNRVLSTRFVGWEGFSSYVTFCDSSIDALSSTLAEMIANPEDSSARMQRRDFISHFIWDEQAGSIYSFIEAGIIV